MNRWALLLLFATSCTRYADEAPVSVTVPSRQSFTLVSAVLEAHCGTLDCHGSPARNFRVYGVSGLRASGDDVTGGVDTTDADVDGTYASLVALDPEVLSRILAEHGQRPERFIAVTKARGLERHDGNQPLPPGSPGDRCLVSWISGSVNQDACTSDVFGPAPRDGETW